MTTIAEETKLQTLDEMWNNYKPSKITQEFPILSNTTYTPLSTSIKIAWISITILLILIIIGIISCFFIFKSKSQ